MYNLDTEAAKQADQKGGSITEGGKYIGTFTRAENVTSTKGTAGVEFSFKSDDGRSADYLTLWTRNAEGKELYGYKTLMAIMTCLRVKTISPSTTMVEKYNHDSGQREQVQAQVFNELMNKPIGLLIQMEEYEGKKGRAWKPVIYAPFDKDGFTASEILSKATKAETLDKMLLGLRDRPLKASAAVTQQHAPQQTGTIVDFDDDIPF